MDPTALFLLGHRHDPLCPTLQHGLMLPKH